MKINQKLKYSIITQLEKIRNSTFDEDSIKMLLIDIRDLSNKYHIIKEISHFIAHPERDQGLFQKKIYSRWLRIKFINEEFSKLDLSKANKDMSFDEFIWKNRNPNEFDQIPKSVFKSVFQDGLSDFSELFFLRAFGKSRDEIRRIISNCYRKKDGFYILRSGCRSRSDYFMRIIQTTVIFSPIFSQEELCNQLKGLIRDLEKELNSDISYIDNIIIHINEIYLCILCLLHDVTFKSNKAIIGNSFLSASDDNKIILGCTFIPLNTPFTFPLLSSENLLSDFSNDKVETSLERLDKFSLQRKDGLLWLF